MSRYSFLITNKCSKIIQFATVVSKVGCYNKRAAGKKRRKQRKGGFTDDNQ
jgi:hypothetical protein